MSTNLYWEPESYSTPVPDDGRLKQILRKGWGQPHGVDRTVDADALDYLRGLDDAGIEGADSLIEALSVHERVRVYEK